MQRNDIEKKEVKISSPLEKETVDLLLSELMEFVEKESKNIRQYVRGYQAGVKRAKDGMPPTSITKRRKDKKSQCHIDGYNLGYLITCPTAEIEGLTLASFDKDLRYKIEEYMLGEGAGRQCSYRGGVGYGKHTKKELSVYYLAAYDVGFYDEEANKEKKANRSASQTEEKFIKDCIRGYVSAISQVSTGKQPSSIAERRKMRKSEAYIDSYNLAVLKSNPEIPFEGLTLDAFDKELRFKIEQYVSGARARQNKVSRAHVKAQSKYYIAGYNIHFQDDEKDDTLGGGQKRSRPDDEPVLATAIEPEMTTAILPELKELQPDEEAKEPAKKKQHLLEPAIPHPSEFVPPSYFSRAPYLSLSMFKPAVELKEVRQLGLHPQQDVQDVENKARWTLLPFPKAD